MSEERKSYRTNAYNVTVDGKPHVFFWSMDPAYNEPGKYWVREHDLYETGSYSKLITDSLPEREILNIMKEIESANAKKYPVAPESFKDHRWIGSHRDAALLAEHPDYGADKREQALKTLKARKRPGLSL